PGYEVLFDFDAEGRTELVNGYGAYLQYYSVNPARPHFRYCHNFECRGLEGRPNLNRQRMRHVPYGTEDQTAFICKDYSLADFAAGRKLVYMGEKYFFAIKTQNWDPRSGGQIHFHIARKLPLIGAPKYKLLRIDAVRQGAGGWKVETLIPRGPRVATDWMHYVVTESGLGIPNGVRSLVLNPATRTERDVDLDSLESIPGI